MNEGTMREIVDKPLRTAGNSSEYYVGHSVPGDGCRTPRDWPAFSNMGGNQQDSALGRGIYPRHSYGDSIGGGPAALYDNNHDNVNGHNQTGDFSMSRTMSKCPFGHSSTSTSSRNMSHSLGGQGQLEYPGMAGMGMMRRTGCYWKEMWKKLDIMRQLWQLCDVTLFSCDDAMFMAHSPVLAASSDVFHNFFINHTEGSIKALSERSMKLANVPRDVLQVTLDFIYGVTPTTALDFEKLMSGARVLGLHGAAKYCQTQGYAYPDATAEQQDNSFKPPYEVPCSVSQHKNYMKDSHIIKTSNHGKVAQTISSIQTCSEQNFDENYISESIDLRIGQNNQNSLGKFPPMETFPEDPSDGIANSVTRAETTSVETNENSVQLAGCPVASPKAGTTVCNPPTPAVPTIMESPTGKKAEYPILPARKRDRPPKKSMELRDISFQEFLPDNHPDIMSDQLALNGRCPVLHGGGASLDPEDADEVLASAPVSVLLDECDSVGTPQPESDMEQSDEPELAEERADSLGRCSSPVDKAPKGYKHFPNEAKMEPEEGGPNKSSETNKDMTATKCARYGKDVEPQKAISSSGTGNKPTRFGPTPRSRGKPDVFDYASCPEWIPLKAVDQESDESEQHCNQNGGTTLPYGSLMASSVPDQSQYPAISNNVSYSSSDGENSEDIHILDNCTDNLGKETPRQPLTEEEKKAAAHENTKLVANLNQDTKRRYMCLAEGCGYVNKHLDYLQSHMYHRHNLGRPDRQCEYCDHRYFSDGQLKTHVRRSHQEGNRTTDASHKACPDCGATFSTGYTLQMHLLKAHGKGRLFTCEDCEFKSPRKKKKVPTATLR